VTRTAGDALAEAVEALRAVSSSPRLDAEVLLAHVLGRDRAHLLAHPEAPLSAKQASLFTGMVECRAGEMPLAYLTGACEFYGLRFHVNARVLVPRPETEHLVEAAIAWAKGRPSPRIVDVGTGSGAIAVTLAKHLPAARVTATDTTKRVLKIAAQNAEQNGVADRIDFVRADLLPPRCKPADLIAANLPYIPTAVLNRLPPHEPHEALDGGEDGLLPIKRLLRRAPKALKAESLLLLEIGFGQADAVRALAADAIPGAQIDVIKDYAGHPRVVRVEQP
jgi:release factor glutamine methyltransferase